MGAAQLDQPAPVAVAQRLEHHAVLALRMAEVRRLDDRERPHHVRLFAEVLDRRGE
jgi:hypothetical protein